MTDTAASALAVWFRDASATSAYAGEFNNASVFDREGMLYLDAAGLAESLPRDDERLARLVEADRFMIFYGDLMFLGGSGGAVRRARSSLWPSRHLEVSTRAVERVTPTSSASVQQSAQVSRA
jgi:hypothetical protein